jgi:hypothetical protein
VENYVGGLIIILADKATTMTRQAVVISLRTEFLRQGGLVHLVADYIHV